MIPDKSKKKAPEIYSHTALRGIAAMYVVMFHLGWSDEKHEQNNAFFQIFHWGGYAVDLFFILSGFILNWVYLSKPTVNWASYLRSRAARILPLYFLTTLLYLPVPIYSMIKHGLVYVGKDYPKVLFLNLFLISGIVGGFKSTINIPAWSISVEYFCYLLVFPLLYLSKNFYEKKSRGLILLVLAACFSTFACISLYGQAPINILGFMWDGTWLWRGVFGFSTGFLLCSIYKRIPVHKITNWMVNSIFMAAFAVFICVLLRIFTNRSLLIALPPLVFFSATDRGFFAKFLETRLLQWLGERSYSIYLWHMFVKGYSFDRLLPHLPIVLNDIVYSFLVLVVAEISYRFFECPCREYIRKTSFSLTKRSPASRSTAN